MSKYIYRLWFPMVNVHGSDFNKLCEKCQQKIEDKINDGYVLPTTLSIDTSIGMNLTFGFSMGSVELCKKCASNLKEFLDSAEFLSFGKHESIQLWRNLKEEASE